MTKREIAIEVAEIAIECGPGIEHQDIACGDVLVGGRRNHVCVTIPARAADKVRHVIRALV